MYLPQATLITVIFSSIEFQYNAILALEADAEGIAQVTANLASFAGVGQALVNLALTPTLLQSPPVCGVSGAGLALLVTPLAYAAGEVFILSGPSVATVFTARLLDFLFRYTINDSAKQIVWLVLPHRQLMDARAFIDGTLKKAAPALVGALLITAQRIGGGPAESLVVPLAFVALFVALGTLPLIVYIARVHAAMVSEATRARLRNGIWGMVIGLRKEAPVARVGEGAAPVARVGEGAAPVARVDVGAAGAAGAAVGAARTATAVAATAVGVGEEAPAPLSDDEEWDDEEFEALERNTIADVVASGDYARAAHAQRERHEHGASHA